MAKAIPNCKYLHKNGGRYLVLGIVKNTETNEDMVLYRTIDGESLFVRPQNIFEEEGRFLLISDEDSIRYSLNELLDLIKSKSNHGKHLAKLEFNSTDYWNVDGPVLIVWFVFFDDAPDDALDIAYAPEVDYLLRLKLALEIPIFSRIRLLSKSDEFISDDEIENSKCLK